MRSWAKCRKDFSSNLLDIADPKLLARTLIFAAMDTTSSALARIMYMLATNPEAQDRLRAEVRAAKEQYGTLSYDELEAMPFLDAVCRETLRLCVTGNLPC